jgi:uncharacterized membrane protein YsdA (DUF1294 family)
MLGFTVKLPWPIWIYLAMSVATFVLYFIDKSRARSGAWRISENTLHVCELLGGWPGAFAAQQCFRHKTKKTRYRVMLWSIVAVHVLFWGWYLGWVRGSAS